MSAELTYTVTHDQSADRFNDVIELYLSSSSKTMAELDQLISLDPDMAMAHAFRACLLKLASDPRFITPATASLRKAQRLPTNAREAMHLSALQQWFAGDTDQSLVIYEQLLGQYPTDVLAARVAQHLHFYSGDAIAMRGSIEKVASHFSAGDRFYNFVLGMHSFGCEEAGDYQKAEALGRQAVALNANDQWAVHAVAHVMQMQARFDEGVSWLSGRAADWPDSNNFVNHIHWHEALFELGRDAAERALEIYDNLLVTPLTDDFYLDVCNAASLLWRLEMRGLDVGDRWQALTPYQGRTHDTELIFCTLHYLLAPARLGDEDAISEALASLEAWQQEQSTQGQVVAEVGIPLANAIRSLSNQDYAGAVQLLESAKPTLAKIGGSHAQRELFIDMQNWARRQAA